MPNKKFALLAAVLSLVSSSSFAYYQAEVGDAGDSLATAQVLAAGVTGVTGNLASGTVDMFQFYWNGGAFYVNTQGSAVGDTQLFLFNSSGAGVWANDDGLPPLGSYIEDLSLAAGTYYLALSAFNNDPLSASGVMFTSSPFSPQYGPLHGSEPLLGWTGGGTGGDYQLNFRSATGETVSTGSVPEPGTMALLGLGFAGLAATRRKKG